MANFKIYNKKNNKQFCASYHHFRDFSISNFYHENLGQGTGAQHSQWCTLMANINLYKSQSKHFYTGSHCFRDINVLNLENVCKGHRVHECIRNDAIICSEAIRWWILTSLKVNLYKVTACIFTLALTISDMKVWNVWSEKNIHNVWWQISTSLKVIF